MQQTSKQYAMETDMEWKCSKCGAELKNLLDASEHKCERILTEQIQTAPKNNEQENKPMPTLLPMDILLRYLEPAYREGLIKYSRESWRQGFKVSDMVDAGLRHIIEFFYEKQDFDPDAEKLGVHKHHLGGALFSLLCILQTLENRPELDDRFFNDKRKELNQ